MADSIGQAYVQILPTTKGFGSKLSSQLSGGGGESGGIKSAGLKIGGKFMAGMVAATAAGAAAVGAAAVKGISAAVKQGGELQQSLGGVEALFGKSADKVKTNAAKSFQTVGISANEYMQQVTSFSASLVSGLNGDTQKAANIADIAMKDMGDNVNRFGTAAESVQNAYQGFAKGNFTMLDNLKLGYGGTKTEMLRLVKDAGVVDKSVKSIDDVTFDQMILGIHKIQENLNVTGTTAKEASSTLEGSFNSLKAVGKDLLGNLALGMDVKPQITALISTAKTFLSQNLLPMIKNVIDGVVQNAPALTSGFQTLVSNIGNEIIRLIPTIATQVNAVLPTVFNVGANLLLTLGNSLISSIPTLFPILVNVVMKLATGIIQAAPMLLSAGISLIIQLGQALITGLPKMLPQLATLITKMALLLTKPSTLTKLIMTGVDLIMALANGLLKALPILINSLPQIIMNVVSTFIKLAPKLAPVGLKMLNMLVKGLISAQQALHNAVIKLGKMIVQKFKSTNWKQLGMDIIRGITNGFNSLVSTFINAAKGGAKRAWNAFKSFFKIGSPSKLMEATAKWIPVGAALGISKNSYLVDEAIAEMGSGAGSLMRNGSMSLSLANAESSAAEMNYQNIYDAVKKGASEAQPILVINGRVMTRELKGMGVQFA